MKHVCFVGASTVEGLGDESGLGWPGRLAAMEREAGRAFVPYNLGVRGQTLREIGARAVAECDARLQNPKTDLIVLGTGMNDLARIGTSTLRTPQRRTLEDFTKLVKELATLSRLLVVGPFPVVKSKMPFHSAVSGMKFNFRNQDIEEAAKNYGEICAERQVPYLNLYTALSDNQSYTAGLQENDGLHSNGGGYQAVAEAVVSWHAWQQDHETR